MQITSSIGLWALAVTIFAPSAKLDSPLLPVVDEDASLSLEKANARADINPNYRLPNETYPEHYSIELATGVDKGETLFLGEVTIDIVVAKATNDIVLHTRQLEISKATLVNLSTNKTYKLIYNYELKREFLTLRRKNKKGFAAGTKWKLMIAYTSELRNDRRGFYLSNYVDENGTYRYLASTHFESTNARHAFPCYDEPGKRANFTITIHHSPNYTAISNMPVNEALSRAGKTVFRTTPRMSTYLVAFVISDFVYTEGVLNGLRQRVYSRPNAKKDHAWALMTGIMIADHLSKYCGIEFMLPKMDHVAIPNLKSGGMENWGLATYREDNLLYNKNASNFYAGHTIAKTVAHEVAHQWLGNYVTIEWWTYLWLKEGLATVFSCRALVAICNDWGIWQDFHVAEYQKALQSEGGDSTRPMTSYVQTPAEIAGIYDVVTYSNAATVLLMWSHALTDTIFQKALQIFLTKHKYSAVTEEDLFDAIQTAVEEGNYTIPATIKEMMSTWTHQGGYPVLTVTRNYDDGTFTVTQEDFHTDRVLTNNLTWYVPINYAVASNPDFRETQATHYLRNVIEMKLDDIKVAKKDWLMLNKQSTGYYRTNYDAENWKLITKALIKNPLMIHPRNRAQLMDDAYQFTLSKRLNHATLLKLMSYLKQEDQYAPWSTANNIFSTYIRYLRSDKNYIDLKFFIGELIRPIYKKLDVNDVPDEYNFNKYTRNLVINMACEIGILKCLVATNNKLKDLLYKNTSIEPNLEDTIYCNGLKKSEDEVFDLLYQKLMNSTDRVFRRKLIYNMGCTKSTNQIKKLIYSSIDMSNNLYAKERYTLLYPVYTQSAVGFLACIEFLNKNWHVYGSLQGARYNPLDTDILRMASYVLNKKQEEQLLALVAKVKGSKHVSASLTTAVKKRIANNFDWLKTHGGPIMSWITKYRIGNGTASSAASKTTT